MQIFPARREVESASKDVPGKNASDNVRHTTSHCLSKAVLESYSVLHVPVVDLDSINGDRTGAWKAELCSKVCLLGGLGACSTKI